MVQNSLAAVTHSVYVRTTATKNIYNDRVMMGSHLAHV